MCLLRIFFQSVTSYGSGVPVLLSSTFAGSTSALINGSAWFGVYDGLSYALFATGADPDLTIPLASGEHILNRSVVFAGVRRAIALVFSQSLDRYVLRIFDRFGEYQPTQDWQYEVQSTFKLLGIFRRKICFHSYQPTQQLSTINCLNEDTLANSRLVETATLWGNPAVDSVVVNNWLVVRYSSGSVVMTDGSSSLSNRFGYAPPLHSRSKRLVFGTEGPAGRLYFPSYDNSYGEALYASAGLPCFDSTDCAPLGASFDCVALFCAGPPLAPEAPPSFSPAAPPIAPSVPVESPSLPVGAPQASLAPGQPPTQIPAQQPVPPPPRSLLQSPTLICPPPRPLNATCTPSGWVVTGSVIVPPGTTITFPSPTVIVGNFTLGTGSVVNLTGTAVPITVQGCITFDGTLGFQGSDLGSGSVNLTLIQFDGYCGGQKTEFRSATIDLGCSKLKPGVSPLVYEQRSLSLLLTPQDIDTSGCSTAVAEGALSTGAVVGIAVGAGALVVLVIALVLWFGRHRIIPYYKQERAMRLRAVQLQQDSSQL